jgi:hypothetical protein
MSRLVSHPPVSKSTRSTRSCLNAGSPCCCLPGPRLAAVDRQLSNTRRESTASWPTVSSELACCEAPAAARCRRRPALASTFLPSKPTKLHPSSLPYPFKHATPAPFFPVHAGNCLDGYILPFSTTHLCNDARQRAAGGRDCRRSGRRARGPLAPRRDVNVNAHELRVDRGHNPGAGCVSAGLAWLRQLAAISLGASALRQRGASAHVAGVPAPPTPPAAPNGPPPSHHASSGSSPGTRRRCRAGSCPRSCSRRSASPTRRSRATAWPSRGGRASSSSAAAAAAVGGAQRCMLRYFRAAATRGWATVRR